MLYDTRPVVVIVLFKLVVRGWLSKNANNAYNAYAVRGEGGFIDNFRIHALLKKISEVVKYHLRLRSEHMHTKIKLCISLNLVDI